MYKNHTTNNNKQHYQQHNKQHKNPRYIQRKRDNQNYEEINLTLENSLNKISFCDKECFNINNNQTKANIVNYIQSKYKIKIIDREYVPLNPHMLRNISNHEHYLATYSNGNPYLLWLTKIDGKNCSIFIDRKLKDGYSYPKIHLVQYDFDEHIFDVEMVFTGELVRDINREWCYLISDLIIHEGVDITKTKNILSRFNLIYTILDKHFKSNPSIESCSLYVKKLWQYSQIDELFDNYLPSLSYICKGIVFYTMNNQFSNYAWIMPRDMQIRVKPAKEADIDFYELYPDYKNIGSVITNNNSPENNNSSNTDGINGNNQYYANNSLYVNTRNMIDKIDVNDNIKYMIDKSYVSNMLKKVEKCIKHFCEEQGDKFEDNVVFMEFNVIKTQIPGIYKCLSDDLEDKGILYIPYLELDKYIYNLYLEGDNEINHNKQIRMNCIYYEIFDKWIPIAYIG